MENRESLRARGLFYMPTKVMREMRTEVLLRAVICLAHRPASVDRTQNELFQTAPIYLTGPCPPGTCYFKLTSAIPGADVIITTGACVISTANTLRITASATPLPLSPGQGLDCRDGQIDTFNTNVVLGVFKLVSLFIQDANECL